jgi:hypothetical protein
MIGLVISTEPLDWLINDINDKVIPTTTNDGRNLIISNGLLTREFTTTPNWGTIAYRSEHSGVSILRTIATEATITLDGHDYLIGGLKPTSSVKDYLNRSSLVIETDPSAFQFVNYSFHAPKAPFHWEPGLRFSPENTQWPPKGLHLQVDFKPPSVVQVPEHANVRLSLHYEMYEGAPIMSKWITVQYANTSQTMPIVINSMIVENLPVDKPYLPWNFDPINTPWEIGSGATASWLFVESDEPHISKLEWVSDPNSLAGAVDVTLVCHYYDKGPSVKMSDIKGNKMYLTKFESFHVIEMATDSDDRERVAMSRHRLARLLNPQTQENPIYFHSTNNTIAGFQHGIQQMLDVGFEMYIYSFGSGFNMETYDPDYIEQIRETVQYAKERGIEVGGYDLICLARGFNTYGVNVGDQWVAIDPNNGQLSIDACFASGWYDKFHKMINNFINKTGLTMLETDGPYGGESCASTSHRHHFGVDDSIYWQNKLQVEFYLEMKKLNIFLNVPDYYYFYKGANRVGMGYSEYQYSLPRIEDITISRQVLIKP